MILGDWIIGPPPGRRGESHWTAAAGGGFLIIGSKFYRINIGLLLVHDAAKPWDRRSPERLGINSGVRSFSWPVRYRRSQVLTHHPIE